ncbi:MAG: 2-oxoglutarate dehydrogenase E1 component [Planctomycetota bacterium]|nr:MAG: 2-oxoglutarate dehydrogenase E1 component [Planctomycetota bacterium]
MDSAGTASLGFLEELFDQYQADPLSVGPDWRAYFESLGANGHGPTASESTATASQVVADTPYSDGTQYNGNGAKLVTPDGIATAQALAISNGNVRLPDAPAGEVMPLPLPAHATGTASEERVAFLQDRVDQLVRAYRVRGHLMAEIDPLGRPRPGLPELDPRFYHLTEEDMDRVFSTDTIEGPQSMPLRSIIQRLRITYCRAIGVQFMHMDDLRVRQWLQVRMEGCENRIQLDRRQQLRIYKQMTTATVFEEFIQKRFLGAKSFSLEGAETLVPLLELAIERAAVHEIGDVVLAMAHRGRLNVLANVMGKSPQRIFREFADLDPELHVGRGDVKYHLGHSTDHRAANGRNVHLTLCFNPSHLEFVNPVAIGRVRARQDRSNDLARQNGMVILIHGDAAFAGEGVIQETLNLSELDAYRIGGALHVVVNNQIGFTTGPREARSCTYATDVAKMLQIPIFHVNGEDPEAMAQVVSLAMDFRREFQRDVVIDMYCFRRRGHNEADEPAFTQPALYREIEKRPSVHQSYLERLLKLGDVAREEAMQIAEEHRAKLDAELSVAKSEDYVHANELTGVWSAYVGGRERDAADVDTGVRRDVLEHTLRQLTLLPDGFQPHPKIQKFLEGRLQMAAGAQPLDWSAAEALAMATLATQGLRVRLSGQDCQRGTFSHRHAVVHDVVTDETWCSLEHLASDQARVEIYNSPLSEAGVLGFEYGYSLDCPDGLVMWEAQFGDFVNCAQVVIDQFIVSAEDKWNRLSGLVMLLPHGFEGQGPEHSSARLERFLLQAAKDNIQVVSPTTPAQMFHLLRRQVLRSWRKPLVVMTPKSLLRHPGCVSTIDELTTGTYRRVLADRSAVPPREIRRILLCAGKIAYELEKRRQDLGRHDVAIVRVEQYYPLPRVELESALAAYAVGTPAVWVQEEPENMGAWRFFRIHLGEKLLDRFPFSGVCRQSAASPATGSKKSHDLEQNELLTAAFQS